LPTLPALPHHVDPHHWLQAIDGPAFARKIDAHGCVSLDLQTYSIKQALSGQHVVVCVTAQSRAFDVYLGSKQVKQLPSKGLSEQMMPLERSVDLRRKEARSQARQLQVTRATPRHQRWWA